MGGRDWWFGRGGGRAAEPASWRAERAAKFPGEGARSAPELARDPPPPTASTTGGGRLRSPRLESNVIYLLAGVQPLGVDPRDTPLDFGSPRPTSPAPLLPVRAAPRNTRARIPRAPPRTQTRAGGGPSPGLWRVLQGGSRGGQRGRGWGEPQRSRLSFQSALSVPGWVGPEPLKADPPPALAPAARPELSRPRPWRQTDREFPTASDGAELRAVGAARRFGDRCMLSSLGETQERLGILGGGDQLRAGTMFLVTLYFALPLLGKSRLPLAFLSAESSRGVLAAAHPKLRRGCGGCGRAKFRFGEGDHESSAPRPREAVAARSGPQRFVLGLDFLWFLMTSPGGEWMGSEHSSPGLSAPCESRGARGDAPSRWGVGAYWTRIQTSKGKLFPE